MPLAYHLGPDAAHVGALVILVATFAAAYGLGWLIVPGGRARLTMMLDTARHLLPGRSTPPPEPAATNLRDADDP